MPGAAEVLHLGSGDVGPAAIGPAWRTAEGGWRTLASCIAADVAGWDWEAHRAEGGIVDFTLAWRLGGTGVGAIRVLERIVIDGDTVRVTATVEGDGIDTVAFLVPMIETDGGVPADLVVDADGTASCRTGGGVFRARCPGATLAWEPGRAVNRNGVYRVARWVAAGTSIACELRLDRP